MSGLRRFLISLPVLSQVLGLVCVSLCHVQKDSD